jgi:ribosomal protein L14E/L6E/L27E
MEYKKKLWLNYIATQLTVKDKTFGHLLKLNLKKKNKIKNYVNDNIISKNRKNKLIYKTARKKNLLSLKRGSVLILLTRKLFGKKVVLLDITETGLLVVTGPFSINGISLRRVNFKYTISSGAIINLKKINSSVLNDEYFETLKKSKSKNFQFKNYNYVLSHRIRQNYVDKYIIDCLKNNFFLRAYLKTSLPSFSTL